MPTPRSYDDPCGIARALDRVGERWALLVVRELVLGPKRFTDLRAGLPGASPNVLSQRLRELDHAGVVQRRQLPPPAKAAVYELTPWGHELVPVGVALARWGSRAMPLPEGELSVDALMLALLTTFDAEAAHGLRTRVELRFGDDRFRAQVDRQRLEIARGACDRGDAVITTDVACFRQIAFGRRDPEGALREGALRIEGNRARAEGFLGLFERPVAA